VASKTVGGTVLVAEKTVPVGSTDALCGSGACTDAGAFDLAELTADSCVRGRAWKTGEASPENPYPAAFKPVYVFSTSPDVSCQPSFDDPATWGTLEAQGETDADGNFCVPFDRVPNNGSTVDRWLVVADCAANKWREQFITEDINAPDGSCDELTCIDAGDVFLQDFGGGGGSEA
jgi:hypothetical protein